MANSDFTCTTLPQHNGLTATEDEGCTIVKNRLAVILEATYEINDLARLLMDQIETTVFDLDDSPHAERQLRGISIRIQQLNLAILSGIGDEGVEVRELDETVYGKSRTEEANHV